MRRCVLVLRPIYTERKRKYKRKFSLMFTAYSFIFSDRLLIFFGNSHRTKAKEKAKFFDVSCFFIDISAGSLIFFAFALTIVWCEYALTFTVADSLTSNTSKGKNKISLIFARLSVCYDCSLIFFAFSPFSLGVNRS